MADNTAVTDKTTPAPEKPAAPDLTSYVLDRPTAATPPAPESPAAGARDKDMSVLDVTPLQTPGWKSPESTADAAKASPTDANNLEKSLESEGRTDINQGQENILNAAKEAVGKELWKGTKHESVVSNGVKGAAVSVSEILKSSGVTESVDSASISVVEQQMKATGFVEKGLADANPGDVVVYQRDPNSGKRIGIVGDPNDQGKPTIYQMDPNGTWRHQEMRIPSNARTKVYTPGCGE